MTTPSPPFCEIRLTWRKLHQLDQQLKTRYEVSLDEAILLCCLKHNCKQQGNIADETGLTPTQASRVLSRLEGKGLINRSIGTDDRRKMIFTITPRGHQKLEAITPAGEEYLTL